MRIINELRNRFGFPHGGIVSVPLREGKRFPKGGTALSNDERDLLSDWYGRDVATAEEAFELRQKVATQTMLGMLRDNLDIAGFDPSVLVAAVRGAVDPADCHCDYTTGAVPCAACHLHDFADKIESTLPTPKDA